MAQTPKPTSRRRRFFGWFARHKVSGVFAVLVVVLCLYLIGSWIVLQVQIHFERERFLAAKTDLTYISSNVIAHTIPANTSKTIASCSYTSVVIGKGSRSCDVDTYTIYAADNISAAKNLSQSISNFIGKTYALSSSSRPSAEKNNLATYNLKLRDVDLQCFIDYWYFQDFTLPFDAGGLKPTIQNGLLSQMNCGGGARAEYFPVVEH